MLTNRLQTFSLLHFELSFGGIQNQNIHKNNCDFKAFYNGSPFLEERNDQKWCPEFINTCDHMPYSKLVLLTIFIQKRPFTDDATFRKWKIAPSYSVILKHNFHIFLKIVHSSLKCCKMARRCFWFSVLDCY